MRRAWWPRPLPKIYFSNCNNSKRTPEIVKQSFYKWVHCCISILHINFNEHVTIALQIPTSDNTTVPVQIKLPQLLTTSSADGTTNTVVLQQSMNQQQAIMSTADMHNQNHTTLTTSSATMIPWQQPLVVAKPQTTRKYIRKKEKWIYFWTVLIWARIYAHRSRVYACAFYESIASSAGSRNFTQK